MIVSGYSMDIYCDSKDVEPWHSQAAPFSGDGYAQFTGKNWTECIRQARREGWVIGRDNQRATCPRCKKDKD